MREELLDHVTDVLQLGLAVARRHVQVSAVVIENSLLQVACMRSLISGVTCSHCEEREVIVNVMCEFKPRVKQASYKERVYLQVYVHVKQVL